MLGVFIAGLMVGRTPEFLGKKIEAREVKLAVARHDRRAHAGAGRHGGRDRDEVRARRRSTTTGRRASPRPSTPTRRRPTTTAPRSPATRASSSRTARTPARSASRSPTSSAAWRCSPGASSRSSPRSPSRARWPASASRPPGSARCAPTRPRSRVLLVGVVLIVRPHLLPRAAPRPRRPGPHRPALLMMRDSVTAVIAVLALTAHARARLSARDDRRRAGRLPGTRRRVAGRGGGQVVGSTVIGQDFSRSPRAARTPTATRCSRRICATSRAGRP